MTKNRNKMQAEGIIRKIIIGDIKEGMTYKVGQQFYAGKQLTVRGISYDVETQFNTGDRKYDVLVSEEGSSLIRLWKSFINVPTSVEYDISIERDA